MITVFVQRTVQINTVHIYVK